MRASPSRRIDLDCVRCGKPFSITPTYYKRGVRRCSLACATAGKRGRPKSLEHRYKIGLAQRGKRHSWITPDGRKRLSLALRGRKRPPRDAAWSAKISAALVGRPRFDRRGPLNPMWRGGISSEHHRIRQSAEYKTWRKAVFERDNHTCQTCGMPGGNLEADHIKPFALFPELRFDVSNGRTLCRPCHRNTPTWGKKVSTYDAERRGFPWGLHSGLR